MSFQMRSIALPYPKRIKRFSFLKKNPFCKILFWCICYLSERFLYVLLMIFALSGCKSEFTQFNEKALAYAKSDSRIDEKEYNMLIKEFTDSEDKGFKQFKDDNGNIDDTKLVYYLLKYLNAKKVAISETAIWQPQPATNKEQTFNINVFLENSASMDGYVKGVTEFEAAIYNLLGDFKISGICDSLNLNYINKSIRYSKKNALSADIRDFIEKLEPSTFQLRGGDRSVSDLKNILSTVLKTVNNKNAAVLISDFVFSPGKNTNAQDYLNTQGVGIKIDFAEKLKAFDLSVVVIQLQSKFDGIYYDKTNNDIEYNGKRPYYVWVIGNKNQIGQILNKKILDNIKGGYTNKLVFQSIKASSEPKSKILYRPRIGEFDSKLLAQRIITNASASKENKNKGIFGFNVAVDFSNSIHDANYFLDIDNYLLSNPKYQLQVEIIEDKNDPSLSGFTHLLKLKTNELRDGFLKIDVVGKTPSWVNTSTSFDDSNILSDKTEQQKTFGLKYLIDGVSDAFYPKSGSNTINSISVTIKK
ncbi:MAG TPA: hypothetical protein PKC39_15990 [Ferruginibacter sp.]|nr:hypothetical protein [Ferruginibacter sp.]